MIIDLVKYLTVAMGLFVIGVWGIFLNRKNIIIMLMSIELMLLAVNLNFIIFSVYLDDLLGQVFSIFILTVAAAESAIGLSILVIYSRIKGSLAIEIVCEFFNNSKNTTQSLKYSYHYIDSLSSCIPTVMGKISDRAMGTARIKILEDTTPQIVLETMLKSRQRYDT